MSVTDAMEAVPNDELPSEDVRHAPGGGAVSCWLGVECGALGSGICKAESVWGC